MTPNIQQITGFTDPLLKQYNALAFAQNIPDLRRYALDWYLLARAARHEGRRALSEMCLSRAKHYRAHGCGEFVRLFDAPFAELVEVAG